MTHYYINRRAKHILDACSISSGMLFQLNWNILGTGYGLNYKGERQGASHTDLAVLTPEGKFRH